MAFKFGQLIELYCESEGRVDGRESHIDKAAPRFRVDGSERWSGTSWRRTAHIDWREPGYVHVDLYKNKEPFGAVGDPDEHGGVRVRLVSSRLPLLCTVCNSACRVRNLV